MTSASSSSGLPYGRDVRPSSGRPAVFFDRDGVVNVSPGDGFVTSWDAFHFTPGVVAVLAEVKAAGWPLVLITNQRAVAVGLLSDAQLDEIHGRMQEALACSDAAFDAIYCATGDRTDPRRKPSPAMPREAAADLGLDLARSVFVGDDDRDVRCARAAGIGWVIRLLGDKAVGEPADETVANAGELGKALGRLLGARAMPAEDRDRAGGS